VCSYPFCHSHLETPWKAWVSCKYIYSTWAPVYLRDSCSSPHLEVTGHRLPPQLPTFCPTQNIYTERKFLYTGEYMYTVHWYAIGRLREEFYRDTIHICTVQYYIQYCILLSGRYFNLAYEKAWPWNRSKIYFFLSFNCRKLEIIVFLTIFSHIYVSCMYLLNTNVRKKYLADCVLCNKTIFFPLFWFLVICWIFPNWLFAAQKLLSFPSVKIFQYTVSCVWDTLRCGRNVYSVLFHSLFIQIQYAA
jgi:hypothetical protein